MSKETLETKLNVLTPDQILNTYSQVCVAIGSQDRKDPDRINKNRKALTEIEKKISNNPAFREALAYRASFREK